MVQIFVCSRRAIEQSNPLTVPHLFISIRPPGDPQEVKLPASALTRGVLHLEFYDLDRVPEEPIPLIGLPKESWLALHHATAENLFNETMARQVLDFVRPHVEHRSAPDVNVPEVRAIVVHCDAGWSRSPAVAAALTKTLLGQDDGHWFRAKRPNMLVYRTLLNVFHESKGSLRVHEQL